MLRKKLIKRYYFLKKGIKDQTNLNHIRKIETNNKPLNILATENHKNCVYQEITDKLSEINEIHKIACKLLHKWEIIVLNQ